MKSRKIPNPTIMRLSLYYRGLAESRKEGFISSRELSEVTGFSPEQIRQDFSYFGQLGYPGKGYEISLLMDKIKNILGIDKRLKVIVVGIGNLGSALMSYRGFQEQGFDIVSGFDVDPKKIGGVVSGKKVMNVSSMKKYIRKHEVKFAVLTVPSGIAHSITEQLVAGGIRAILNFTPARLKLPREVKLLNVDLGVELERLSCLTLLR